MALRDETVERAMGALLRTGVLISAAVVLAGGIWRLIAHGGLPADYHTFRGEAPEFRSISAVAHGVFGGDERSLIQAGVLLLIATPLARVAFALVAFALQKDRTYAIISAVVMSILLYGLLAH